MAQSIQNYPMQQLDMPNVEPSASSWTRAKTQKVAECIFGTLAAGGAVGLVVASLTGAISGVWAVAALPVAIIAFAFFKVAAETRDYEDPIELAQMRARAPQMSFTNLYQEHGIQNLFRHFSDVLPIEELQRKLHSEIQAMDFEKVLTQFPMEDLVQVATPEYIRFLNELKENASRLDREFEDQKQTIDQLHPTRTEKVKKKIHQIKNMSCTSDLFQVDAKKLDTTDFHQRSMMRDQLELGAELFVEHLCKDEQMAFDREMAAANTARMDARAALNQLHREFVAALIQAFISEGSKYSINL